MPTNPLTPETRQTLARHWITRLECDFPPPFCRDGRFNDTENWCLRCHAFDAFTAQDAELSRLSAALEAMTAEGENDPAEQRAERYAMEAVGLTERLMQAEAEVARLIEKHGDCEDDGCGECPSCLRVRVKDAEQQVEVLKPGGMFAWKSKADALQARVTTLEGALRGLRIDANRLCDRNLGGTYEEDCRRSIAVADAALTDRTETP